MSTSPIPFDALTMFPAVAYLVAVIGVLAAFRGRCPAWVHVAGIVIGFGARVWVEGWGDPLLSVAVTVPVFIALVAVASRTLTGTSLFTCCVVLALTPISEWPFVVAGLVLASLVAGWRTWRLFGSSRLAWLTMDTMGAMGVTPAGSFKRPEMDLLPTRDQLTDVHDGSLVANRARMYLAPYLLAGVLLGVGVQFLI